MADSSATVERTQAPAWMTYRQASAYTGFHRTKLHRLWAAGEIEARRAGRAVRIKRESLDDYMESLPNTPGPAPNTK